MWASFNNLFSVSQSKLKGGFTSLMRFGDASMACGGHTFSLVESEKYHKAVHIVEMIVLVE